MQTIYITIGNIGSGKSTWAKEKAKEDNTIIICRDSLRNMIKGEYLFDIQYEGFVGSVSHKMVIKAIQLGHNVILDECNIWSSKREYTLNLIAKAAIDFWNCDIIGEEEVLTLLVAKVRRHIKIVYVWFDDRGEEYHVSRRMNDPRTESEDTWREVYNKFGPPQELSETEIALVGEIIKNPGV